MSTWHQRQNPVPLWHPVKWTVVSDPPEGMTCVERFDSAKDAIERAEKIKGYVLPPNP